MVRPVDKSQIKKTFFLFPVDKTTNVDAEKFFKMKA